jgi:hypothetical protein
MNWKGRGKKWQCPGICLENLKEITKRKLRIEDF